jgi:uncharacterized protein YodC (DUF2158 family)
MKTQVSLLSPAFSLCLVATVGISVSCEKSGPEDEPMVGEEVEEVEPRIIPSPGLSDNEYEITSDGTTISEKSVGFSFYIYAGALTLHHFNCILDGREQHFEFKSSCNLTLKGNSFITTFNNAIINLEDVKLSGFGGSLTISMANSDFTNLKSNISAAEGYTMTVSDVSYDGKGFYSCTWKVH